MEIMENSQLHCWRKSRSDIDMLSLSVSLSLSTCQRSSQVGLVNAFYYGLYYNILYLVSLQEHVLAVSGETN